MLATLALSVVALSARPNFLFLFTDDQDLLLDSMVAMPSVRKNIQDAGVTMDNYFAHTPICCPSRSQTLSGRYFHNIRMDTPTPMACMHVNTSTDFQEHTFGRYLTDAGYTTGIFGKYLNMPGMDSADLCPTSKNTTAATPKGWDRFFAMCPDTCYFNCTFNDQGTYHKFNDPAYAGGSNYATSVMMNETLTWLKSLDGTKPFFAYIAPHAPHGPFSPAPWYVDTPIAAKVPRHPSYNYSATNHTWMVEGEPAIDDTFRDVLDTDYQNRLRTLMTVDDGFDILFQHLADSGTLANTYIFFSSDHGFHMGNFRLPASKSTVYQTDVRIPFYARGPSIPAGSHQYEHCGLPDLAPTILELAGVAVPDRMDGRSMKQIITTTEAVAWRDRYLVEFLSNHYSVVSLEGHRDGAPNNTFIALYMNTTQAPFTSVGSGHLMYAEYADVVLDYNFESKAYAAELYDLQADPWQLNNIYASSTQTLRDSLHTELRKEWACVGAECS